ncbi:MAG: hypothetical protein M3256_07180, partial [Actinomycetota bacterium]|nr:hypothetical protein [Actinomycetota bacterium]
SGLEEKLTDHLEEELEDQLEDEVHGSAALGIGGRTLANAGIVASRKQAGSSCAGQAGSPPGHPAQ